MIYPRFGIEDFLDQYEFNTPYMMCSSSVDPFSLSHLLSIATSEERRLWDTLSLGYLPPHGSEQLRETLTEARFPSLSADQVMCFNGSEEAIFCTLHALLSPNDHVIVVTPTYQSHLSIPQAIGCEVTTIALEESRNWCLDVAAIESAITPTTSCVIVNFPNNPTGQVMTQSELDALIAVLEKRGIWLISDEAYHGLGAPTSPWVSLAALCYSKAISLGTLSKAHGLPGLRCGWIACQDRDLLNLAKDMKFYTTICNSAPTETLSMIALRHEAYLIGHNNQLVASNLARVDAFLSRHSDHFSWVRSQGGCVGFVRYHGGDVAAFCDHVRTTQGILLMPGHLYDVPNQHFRLGFGRENLAEGLHHLEAAL